MSAHALGPAHGLRRTALFGAIASPMSGFVVIRTVPRASIGRGSLPKFT